ncbi:MAG: alpha-ketoglutarate-dependent dioxygenase AlkB [Candidatus Pacebacteria bacterium]|nr:alpha-ketoglutarate-dependent dioxygenase AlkB [Candidatus Paceibacterota bacterium]
MSITQESFHPRLNVKKVGRDSFLVENFLLAEGDVDEAAETLASVDQQVQYLARDDPRMQFRIYGKSVQLPRDKAVYGEVVVDEEKKERIEPFYKYAKDTPRVESWDFEDSVFKRMAEQVFVRGGRQVCNHLVVNQYRSGDDYIGDHRDKDETFVPGSSVMTISLGAERTLRLKKFKGRKIGKTKSLLLKPGSLFVLGPKTNAKWKHSIPKSKRVLGRRVSLTFRSIAARRTTSTIQ